MASRTPPQPPPRFILIVIACLIAPATRADEAGFDEWKPLFNGKDFSGWKTLRGTMDPWKMTDDGLIVCEGGEAGLIITESKYADFELSLEFKLPADANSGVFIRTPGDLKGGRPAYVGNEIQLLDDDSEKFTSRINAMQYTGALYQVTAPSKRVSKKAGQWQHLLIHCVGRTLRITLNGTMIINADLDQLAAAHPDHTGLKNATGYIGLQNHRDPVYFRQVRIRTPRREK